MDFLVFLTITSTNLSFNIRVRTALLTGGSQPGHLHQEEIYMDDKIVVAFTATVNVLIVCVISFPAILNNCFQVTAHFFNI